jgi:hypothetical protein
MHKGATIMSEIKKTPENSIEHEEESLAIGESDFETLIDAGSVYVDKTRIIHYLLTRKYRRFFLTRPRRFGKSLLLSTIEDIFHGKEELFNDMFISGSEAKYDWPKCHVIRLDMSSFGNNPQKFDANLTGMLQKIADKHGVRLTLDGSGPALVELILSLYSSFRNTPLVINADVTDILPDTRKIAILIDEYDFPLITNYKNIEMFQSIKDQLYQFYAQLKSVLKYIGFLFITGITKFRVLTSSSGLNSVRDISYDRQYATICGFTREEIRKHFNAFLISAHEDLMSQRILGRLSKPTNALDMIMEWYDGYTWDGVTSMLNPESVLNFFLNNDFGRYWYDTGGPNFLEQLQLKDDTFFELFAKNVSYKGTISLADIGTLTPLASLLQTGYLTIRKPLGHEDGQKKNIYDLVIPNKEVRMSYAEDYLIGRLYPDIASDSEARKSLIDRYKGFCKALGAIQSEKAAEQLSSIYATFPHVFHPDKSIVDREFFYKSHMLPALYYADAIVTAEKREAGGDPDFILEMRCGDIFVMEVKYSKPPDSPDSGTVGTTTAVVGAVADIQANDSAGTLSLKGQALDSALPPSGASPSLDSAGASSLRRENDPKIMDIEKLLDGGIRRAFKQIRDRQYARKYLGGDNAVYAVAVSVAGRFHVKIEFERLNPDVSRG